MFGDDNTPPPPVAVPDQRMAPPSVSPEVLASMQALIAQCQREVIERPADPLPRELLVITQNNLDRALAKTGQQVPSPDTRNEFERRRDETDDYVNGLLDREDIPAEIREAMAKAAADVRRRHGRGN